LENRPSFQAVSPNNVPMQHHQLYSQQTSQIQSTYHHPLSNGLMPVHPHFVDSRLSIMPNQFPEPIRTQGPRMNVPRIDYGSRSSPGGPPGHSGPPGIPVHPPGPSGISPGPPVISGPLDAGSVFNCPANQVSFGPNQGIFSNHVIHLTERGPHPGIQAPLLPILSAPGGPHISGNQSLMVPASQGIPVQSFVRSQAPNPTTHQNHSNVPSQQNYENRIQFSDTQFEGHPSFDSRNAYNLSVNQFNNNVSQITRPLLQNTSQQVLMGITNISGIPSIPNVPTGHKILINPHFRGNPTKNEGKLIVNITFFC
jgi:hypothetical protein